MTLSSQKNGDTLTIATPSTLTATIQKEFRATYSETIKTIHHYIIDLRLTEFADSSGLGLLMLLHGTTKSQAVPPKMRIINARPNIKEILLISGIDKFYDIA